MYNMADLPFDINTGEIRYELEEPLEKLQVMLNKQNINIESLDRRSESQDIMYSGIDSKQLRLINSFIDVDPKQTIKSNSVRNLNDFFDKDLKNNNPNYIFRDDLYSHNNVNTIRQGNKSFAYHRDLLVTPPPIDTHTKILELLQKKN